MEDLSLPVATSDPQDGEVEEVGNHLLIDSEAPPPSDDVRRGTQVNQCEEPRPGIQAHLGSSGSQVRKWRSNPIIFEALHRARIIERHDRDSAGRNEETSRRNVRAKTDPDETNLNIRTLREQDPSA